MMDTAQFENQLTEELSIILGKKIEIEDDLLEAGLDSFATMQLIAYLEDNFGIEVPEERLPIENFKNAQVIIDWVSKMIEKESEK